MVSVKKFKDKVYHLCDECGFAYESIDVAKRCEGWCKENHSCNIDITKHAVSLPD